MTKTNFFDNIVKKAGNELASKASEGLQTDITSWVDTGSYSLNALLSGSIHKGMPSNKIVALAGEESTGKTFYLLSIVKHFLTTNPKGAAVLFETEGAISTDMLIQRGIDTSRVYVIPVSTIQEFRTQAVRILDEYLTTPAAERQPMFMGLDSLGMLSTAKEVNDMGEGKDTRDMTRAQLVRGAFRVLSLKLARANVPMLITNHTYDVVGAYVPTKEMCLVAGTDVWVGEAGVMPIEDLKIGDRVQTLNGPAPVEATHSFDAEVYRLTFRQTSDNGSVIESVVECTEEHKFLVDGEWLSVKDLLAAAENTQNMNREVAHIGGDLNVYRQQILENLSEDD
jgi:RecA/RadA recombinase